MTDKALTFDEIIDLARQPAMRVRRELLQDLHTRMNELLKQYSSLPSALQHTLRVESLPEIAESLRSGRTTIEDLIFWNNLAGVSRQPNEVTVLGEVSTSELWRILEVPEVTVTLFESMGFTPNDYLRCLGTPIMNPDKLMTWASSGILTKDIRGWVLAGVPDPDTAFAWMGEFRERPDFAMIHYLSFGGDLQRAKEWRLRYSPKVDSRPPPIHVPQPVLVETPRAVHHESRTAALGQVPSRPEYWLEEIIARALTVQPSIRKVPHWPARVEFESQNLTIQLEQFPHLMKGVVTVDGDRRWCEFNPSTFEVLSRCETGEDRYVIGMSICWFIDCSITIQRVPRGVTALFVPSATLMSRGRTPQIRYIPTPTFYDRRREARLSVGRLVIRHKVSGHIRKLPHGHIGSAQARSNAPDHIRRNMSQSETFVEPHFRGTEAEKNELIVRLSRFSALGDAMSEWG